MRWIVAHARDDKSFQGTLDAFAQSVAQRSKGRLKVEFIDGKADSQRTDAEADKACFKKLVDGEADMSQIAAGRMGVHVIDEPFLFRSYEHAEAVWRGALGKEMLGEVSKATDGRVEGLAFAYSGGFRVMVGQTPIRKVEDFKGVRMQDTGGEPAEFLKALGVKLVPVSPQELAEVKVPIALPTTGKTDLEETEVNGMAYARQKYPEQVKKIKYVNYTHHSMLVTSMVANTKFLASLKKADREILVDEVRKLSLAERKLSVNLAKTNLEAFKRDGIEVVALPGAEYLKFAKIGEQIQQKSGQAALISKIQAVGEIPLASR